MSVERRSRRAAALAAGVLLLLAACGGSAKDQATPRDHDKHEDKDLEALRALPYVRWSEGADAKLRGVVVHDRERAWRGVNLYTNDRDEVYLMDMEGRRLHTWRLPETPHGHCEYAEILDGDSGADDGADRIAVVCVNDALYILDRRSNIVLEHRDKVHHDLAPLADGSIIVPDKSIHFYRSRMVYFDELAWLDPRGKVKRRWSSWDAHEELQKLHPPSPLDRSGELTQLMKRSYDYYHLNTVESLPATALGERDQRFRAGNLLLCMRNPGLLLILDRDTLDVVWSWGPGDLDGPHMPTLLANGHLLVYDNGTDRDHSRIVELDPTTLEIAWEYRGDPPATFHSKWRGSNERLPNGNTLICESDRGRVFEVTPEGETVWEFWNPELKGQRRLGLYRFGRVDEARVRWAIE